jgi:hypothetical protein
MKITLVQSSPLGYAQPSSEGRAAVFELGTCGVATAAGGLLPWTGLRHGRQNLGLTRCPNGRNRVFCHTTCWRRRSGCKRCIGVFHVVGGSNYCMPTSVLLFLGFNRMNSGTLRVGYLQSLPRSFWAQYAYNCMWRNHLLKQMAVQAIRTSLKYWTICHCLLHLRHLKRHCDHHLRNLKLCLSGMACARRALARGTKNISTPVMPVLGNNQRAKASTATGQGLGQGHLAGHALPRDRHRCLESCTEGPGVCFYFYFFLVWTAWVGHVACNHLGPSPLVGSKARTRTRRWSS